MKKATALALLAVLFAGCKTGVTVDRVSPDTYLLMDEGTGGSATGGNAEQGISRACRGRYIRSIREEGNGPDQRVFVYCGPPLPKR